MNVKTPSFGDARLSKRFLTILQNHIKTAERNNKGLKLIPSQLVKPFAHTQGLWRFLSNEKVTIKDCSEPLLFLAHQEIDNVVRRGRVVLMAHDWSHVSFKNHSEKEDVYDKSGKGQTGYELQSSLAIDGVTGQPIAPVAQNLKTKHLILSSYNETIDPHTTHLKELETRIDWLEKEFPHATNIHVIDREGDSVPFTRSLNEKGFKWVVRAKNIPSLYFVQEKQLMNCRNIATCLKFKQSKQKVLLRGQKSVQVLIGETIVGLQRLHEKDHVPPPHVRLVIVKLLGEHDTLITEWFLLTNIDTETADREQIVSWYCHRWNIESYFKLLKSAGHNLEDWRQQTAEFIFKRLLIASYASALVYTIANQEDAENIEFRNFLIRLSGRVMDRKKQFTYPALLAGLWTFLTIRNALDEFDKEYIMDMNRRLDSMVNNGGK